MSTSVKSLLLLAVVLLCGLALTGTAQTVDNREITLRDRLVNGLQVRRPSEFRFIDAVVDTIDRGELPIKLVDRFYFWARGRSARGRGHRPIIYFQPALTIQASKLRITIEPTP